MFMPIAAAALLVGTVVARPEYQNLIPNGLAGSDPSSGISCPPLGHKGCKDGAERNEFGLAFKAAGLKWTKELCEADSDGDGESNGSELGDPCCLWSPSNTNPKGFRVTNLSHPGDATEDGSMVAPKCEDIADEGKEGGEDEGEEGGEEETSDGEQEAASDDESSDEPNVPEAVTTTPAPATEPATIEAPVVTEAPTEPAATEAATEATTDAPAVTEESVQTDIPVTTEADTATGAPVVTEAPTEPTTTVAATEPTTDAPAVTEAVVATTSGASTPYSGVCIERNTPCSSADSCCGTPPARFSCRCFHNTSFQVSSPFINHFPSLLFIPTPLLSTQQKPVINARTLRGRA